MKTKAAAFSLALALALALVLAGTPARAGRTCAEQVQANCTSCHYENRICEQIGKKSRRAWKVTIKRMLRYGMQLQGASQEEMLECLLALEQDRGGLCR